MGTDQRVTIDVSEPFWDRFFCVAPLVLIGTRERNGENNFAPKHMATPIGWDNFFGFVCTPRHGTYQNIQRSKEFTVTFPRPTQVVLTSLAASSRCGDDTKPILQAIDSFPAQEVQASFLADGYVFLECTLDRIVDGFGVNSLIVGRVVAAQVDAKAIRASEQDDADLIRQNSLLAYLSPGRFAKIDHSYSFPFPNGFKR